MRRIACLVASGLLVAASATAGPNAGGVLLLHAEQSIEYSSDIDFCGQATPISCEEIVATVSVDPGEIITFFAVAAFPDGASPRMIGITFGVDYDADGFVLVDHGSCADFELATDDWPTPGSGTALTWSSARTTQLCEVSWFAGYEYSESSTSFYLTAHPTQGGAFADDSVPAVVDSIAGYGTLGFGVAGSIPCPGDDSGGADESDGPIGSDDDDGEPDSGSGDYDTPDLGTLTFVELAADTDSAFADMLHGLESDFSIRVLVAITPDIVFCTTRDNQLEQLEGDERVLRATTSAIANAPTPETTTTEPGEPGLGPTIWNYVLSPAQPETTSYAFAYACALSDSAQAVAQDVLPEYDQNRQTSTFMMGRVGLSLFWLESQDSRDCAAPDYTENWTLSERSQVLAEFSQGLVEAGLQVIDPRAQVGFNIYDLIVAPTSVEPIRGLSTSETWGREALAYAGYGSGDLKTRAYALNNDRRRSWQTDWWYTALVVRDICDLDGKFSDGKSAFAWLYGPHLVVTTRNGGYGINNLDYVVAHESGHIFGANDEYASSDCSQHCSDRYGYLHVTTDNCAGCTSQQESCIMNSMVRPFRLCSSSRGQLGWRDSEASPDGVFDPIEQPTASSSMRFEETTVYPGDYMDVRTQSGQWVKRVALSPWDADRGGALWDGFNYAGNEVAPAIYIWQKNGTGDWHSDVLFVDEDAPVLSDVSVQSGTPAHLKFEFVDDDTYCGRVRATVSMPGCPDQYAIGDKFYIDTFGSQPPIDVPLNFGCGSGLYTIEVRVWDSGGGREDVETIQYFRGTAADVAEETFVERIGLGYPNPSGGTVEWQVALGSERVKDLGVFGVDGRLVRRLPSQQPPTGSWTILWDGRDGTGRPVASGRYFLRARDASGIRSLGAVTITR